MKKFFTFIATALFAMSANAQTLTFSEAAAAGTVSSITLGDDDCNATFVGGAKASVVEKSQSFKVDASSDALQFSFQWQPGGGITKLTGERSVTINVSTGGTLTVCARTGKSGEVRNFNVVQNGETLLTAPAPDGKEIEEQYYKAYAVEVAAGTVNITAESQINIAGLVFVSNGESGGGSGEESTIVSYDKGTTVGTWSVYNNTELITEAKNYASLDFSSKYNEKKTNATVITFPSGYSKTVEDILVVQSYVKVEGEFKAGDKVTIWPFTQMGDADKANKYANIFLYDADGEKLADMTGSAQGALTVTNNDEAGDPKSFDYTLTNNTSALIFGRQGGTRINLLKVVVERQSTAVEAVAEQQAEAPAKVVKVFKNGKLYIGNYNIAGQQVK